MSRKDSKGLFANVLGQIEGGADRSETPRSTASPHLLKVAAGVRQIQERSELAERLLKDGGQVIEIDPDDVLESAIPDRFASAYDTGHLADLLASMREHGQSTPGLVRAVNRDGKSFQIVFGRRRLAAAKILGIKFRAIARELSDEDAVIFQGEENSNRNDLSFIERCFFAHSQQIAGYGRDVICKSLTTGKSHISEMIRLASALPVEIVKEIGPAPEVGRRRWIDFEARWSAHRAPHACAMEVLNGEAIRSAASDIRFAAVFDALSIEDNPEVALPSSAQILSHGLVLGQVSHGRTGSKLAFNKSVPIEFVEFITGQIESLHDQYMQETKR